MFVNHWKCSKASVEVRQSICFAFSDTCERFIFNYTMKLFATKGGTLLLRENNSKRVTRFQMLVISRVLMTTLKEWCLGFSVKTQTRGVSQSATKGFSNTVQSFAHNRNGKAIIAYFALFLVGLNVSKLRMKLILFALILNIIFDKSVPLSVDTPLIT